MYFTIKALPGISTSFNTNGNTVTPGAGGSANDGGGRDGSEGAASGESIFLRSPSTLNFKAEQSGDLLTLGTQVSFVDDTSYGGGPTYVLVNGLGTVIYNGTSNYQGRVTVENANFKVNGQISDAPIYVCRDIALGPQRGTLSGQGQLTGPVGVNSGTISPDTNQTLTLGGLTLNSATGSTLGSQVHIDINSSGTSLVSVVGQAILAGNLEINLDAAAQPGEYIILSSSGIIGTFDSISFTGPTPNYTLSYLPEGAPTYVKFTFLGVDIPATVNGSAVINPAVVCCGRPVILGELPLAGTEPTVYTITNITGSVQCRIGKSGSQTYLKMVGQNGSCTIVGTKNGITSKPLTIVAP